VYVTPILQTAK